MKLERVQGRTFVYAIHLAKDGPTKVGVARNPNQRRYELQVANPHKLTIHSAIGFTMSHCAYEVESAVINSLALRRLSGEWFDLSPEDIALAARNAASRLGYRWEAWVPGSKAKQVLPKRPEYITVRRDSDIAKMYAILKD